MTENSLKAFYSTMEQRITNKEKVLAALKLQGNHSRFWVGRMTGLGDWEAQKRMGELVDDGKLFISGSRKHGKCDISLYSIKQQLELYPKVKKLTLRKFFENEAPELLHKYDVLYNHKL